MAFHVRDPETDALVRAEASRRGLGITEVIKAVFEDEQRRKADKVAERLRRSREILDEIDKLPRTGLAADKAFFDDLSGD